MPYDDQMRFAYGTQEWAEWAEFGELNSVISPQGSERANLLIHAAGIAGAKTALRIARSSDGSRRMVDFGCGSGRFLRFFGARGWSVIGTEITPEMLGAARKLGLPDRTQLCLTDGVAIPLRDQSVDLIWVCGVLKYSLFDPSSRCRGGPEPDRALGDGRNAVGSAEIRTRPYALIAQEMYRALRPGGFVVNVEMWVEARPEVFLPDFERAGFSTKKVGILRRYGGRPEQTLKRWRPELRLPPKLVVAAGKAVARMRYWFDDPYLPGGLRDYLFVWSKPG